MNELGTKTRDVVRDATLDLVKSFQVYPPRTFVQILIDEIACATTDSIILESAVRRLRQTAKSMPSIAECLEAI